MKGVGRWWGMKVGAAILALAGISHAAGERSDRVGIVGKDGWLFYGYELTDEGDQVNAQAGVQLISQFNRVLADKGIQLVVALVPIKMRLYAQHLPDDLPLTPFMRDNYGQVNQAIQDAGVTTVDLNAAMLSSPLLNSDTPLFFRLDTHWSSTGAQVAAQAVRQTLQSHPQTQPLLDSIPMQKYTRKVGKLKRRSKGRDILQLLPPDSPAHQFDWDWFYPVSVIRVDGAVAAGLLGSAEGPAIALIGSSYSEDWTGFADALRYELQRDLLSLGTSASKGHWYAMLSYMQDQAFLKQPPRLLIWEIPERDIYALPDYRYREQRYQMTNTQWLSEVNRLVHKASTP